MPLLRSMAEPEKSKPGETATEMNEAEPEEMNEDKPGVIPNNQETKFADSGNVTLDAEKNRMTEKDLTEKNGKEKNVCFSMKSFSSSN